MMATIQWLAAKFRTRRGPHLSSRHLRPAALIGIRNARVDVSYLKLTGQPSSENETPKSGRGERTPKWHFPNPIRDAETEQYPANGAEPRGFRQPTRKYRWRQDWLAGEGGL